MKEIDELKTRWLKEDISDEVKDEFFGGLEDAAKYVKKAHKAVAILMKMVSGHDPEGEEVGSLGKMKDALAKMKNNLEAMQSENKG